MIINDKSQHKTTDHSIDDVFKYDGIGKGIETNYQKRTIARARVLFE